MQQHDQPQSQLQCDSFRWPSYKISNRSITWNKDNLPVSFYSSFFLIHQSKWTDDRFAKGGIRTGDLWYRKRPLCQLRIARNLHCHMSQHKRPTSEAISFKIQQSSSALQAGANHEDHRGLVRNNLRLHRGDQVSAVACHRDHEKPNQ